MLRLCTFFLLLSLLPSLNTISVSLQDLQIFFNSTFDQNNDGSATLSQMTEYFQFMQPEHNLTQNDIKQTFQVFDSDSNNKITLRQLLQIARINIDVIKHGHQQIHIGLTNRDGEMQIMWVSRPDKYQKPVVHFGGYPTQMNKKAYAIISTYNMGRFGFIGSIYKAVLTGLQPGKRYYYIVGDEKSKTYAKIKYFTAAPYRNTQLKQVNFAVFGDMGTFAPFGHLVMDQIVRDNLIKPLDFVFLTGDIAYAGMNNEKVGEIEPIWDLFGQLSQSFAAYVPFMPGVGNHQKYYNYTSYLARYDLPKIYPGQTNLWFSFDYGQVHLIHFSSEHDYSKGSEQYMFLQDDLKKASTNPNTKWIILGAHRQFYCSDKDEYVEVTERVKLLQDLVNQYHVDIVQTGHEHCYERTWPTFKGKAQKQGHKSNYFYSPKAPIYVVQGSAGALIKQKWVTPQPEWSIKRMSQYGYGRIKVTGNILKYQYIASRGGKILDEWYIQK